MVDDVTSGRGDGDVQGTRLGSESDDEDLAMSLAALAGLSAARVSLEDLLTEVATFAVQAIPGADGAGLTLIEAGRADTIVKSAPFVPEVYDIQYGLGEGPCISAAALGRPIRSGSLDGDHRWPGSGRGWVGWVCAQCAVAPADQCRSGGRRDERVRARQGRVR